MTWVTPSPESSTIPVDFPVANLNSENCTVRVLLELPRIQLELETFRKISTTFSSCFLMDSYLLQSIKLDIRLEISSTVKKHVSKVITYRPSFIPLHAISDILTYKDLSSGVINHLPYNADVDYLYLESQHHTLDGQHSN